MPGDVACKTCEERFVDPNVDLCEECGDPVCGSCSELINGRIVCEPCSRTMIDDDANS